MTSLEQEIRAGYHRGWSFTPLQGKRPCLDQWQARPRAQLVEAAAWARQGNVGLRTGLVSGVAVVDIEAESPLGPQDFPPTVVVQTGSGGWHLYYRAKVKIPNRSGTLVGLDGERLPKVDVRGEGGQVVFPGSIHPDTGKPYRWWPGCGPDEVSMGPFPTAILRRPVVRRPAEPVAPKDPGRAERRAAAYLAAIEDAVSGQGGHNTTFKAACAVFRFGLDDGAAWRLMQWFNAVKCKPPWSARELDHKIRDAQRVVTANGEIGMHLREGR